jgi:hypothetical protein
MKENILILSIFIACAFSGGVMVAGGLLPATVWYWLIGGGVLVAVMALFIGGLLGVVWLTRPRRQQQEHVDPWREYRPTTDRALQGHSGRPAVWFSANGRQQIDHQQHEQLSVYQPKGGALCRRDRS